MTTKEWNEMMDKHEAEMREEELRVFFEMEDNWNTRYCGGVDFNYSDAFVKVEWRDKYHNHSQYYQLNDRSLLKGIVNFIINETKFREVTVYTANHSVIPTLRSNMDIEMYFDRYCGE